MIGVFDSGIGGLTVLEKVTELLPEYDYIYYGDSKNNPYGEKSEEQLIDITSSIVKKLENMGCKLIVIACNTATTRCMKKLRELFPHLIFVGCVPAIKLACDRKFKNTLVMATPATIESCRTKELVSDNIRHDQTIYLEACYGLANAIERKDNVKIKEILDTIYQLYKEKNIDSIVLGCTHYPYIKEDILKYFPNCELLDGSIGVSKEVKRQLELHHIFSNKEKGNVVILNSLDE